MSNRTSGTGDQQIRDLEWTVDSPPLLNPVDSRIAGHLGEPSPGGAVAAGLPAFLDGRFTHRVGRYFEDLVEYWLLRVRQCRMIARNRQVSDGGRTLGELDFVFEEESGERVHWEVAVKFYLAVEGRFVGPNAHDTLDRKCERLFRHQLPIGEKVFPDLDRREVFVKGRIFYHAGEDQSGDCEALNPGHLRGSWVGWEEAAVYLERWEGADFLVLEKPFWLGEPLDRSNALELMDLVALLEAHFPVSTRPVLLSVGLSGKEVERIFVVWDGWPGDFPAEIS